MRVAKRREEGEMRHLCAFWIESIDNRPGAFIFAFTGTAAEIIQNGFEVFLSHDFKLYEQLKPVVRSAAATQ